MKRLPKEPLGRFHRVLRTVVEDEASNWALTARALREKPKSKRLQRAERARHAAMWKAINRWAREVKAE